MAYVTQKHVISVRVAEKGHQSKRCRSRCQINDSDWVVNFDLKRPRLESGNFEFGISFGGRSTPRFQDQFTLCGSIGAAARLLVGSVRAVRNPVANEFLAQAFAVASQRLAAVAVCDVKRSRHKPEDGD